MARVTTSRLLEPVINAAQQWIQSCLVGDGSVFSNEALWTAENVAEVRSAFVDHPDEGDDNFSTKLKGQMKYTSPSAQRLMAEMVWALLLFPSNIKVSTKRQQVNDLWSMSGEPLAENLPMLSDEVFSGIGSGGPGFNNHRWREVVYLIALVGDLKQRALEERHKLLSDYDAFIEWIAQVPQDGQRQFRHMLRFFCFPDRVERMSSNRERRAVLAGFGIASEKETKKWSDRQLDGALLELRKNLQDANPSSVLDFYEEPLINRWRKEAGDHKTEKRSSTSAQNASVSFSAEDCAVFARYPNSVSWNGVAPPDKEIFKSVWSKLKALAQHLAANSDATIPLKPNTSLYAPSGNSPKVIWSCVYPIVIPNKSYGLQIAVIISARGAEVCFCMGSGTSQIANSAKKQELAGSFAAARNRLSSVPQEVIKEVEESENRKWCYRKSWLTEPNQTDFSSLNEWLSYASSPEGSAASISVYFTPTELQTLGTGIFSVFADALQTFGPILKAVYSGSSQTRHWIFQGNPDQFDVDAYFEGRREIVWSVRQHKDRINVGDRVLVWKSGTKGGVIAECSVIESPSTEILEDAPQLWLRESDNHNDEVRCKLRVLNSFVDDPILRTAIGLTLPELSIIKAPLDTNFEISKAEYEEIINLKDLTIATIPFDSFALSLALEAIEGTQMRIEREFLNRFVRSLIAKPFLILTGNSGTGKTKLAELFVRWLCRNAENGFALVPVGADWTDNRNVLGFVNHLRLTKVIETGEECELPIYQTTKILDLLLGAAQKENERKPHFLILDEMNLSHVERYFADFLSAIESKDGDLLLHREGRPLPRKPGGPCDVPETLVLPQNVFFIGTVNVDETTYMFSPKVLDRANVIEFRVSSDAAEEFLRAGGRSIGNIAPAPVGYAEGFLELSLRARSVKDPALALVAHTDIPKDATEEMEKCRTTIDDLFMIMQKRHQEFAFRSMAEILRFLAVDYELTPETEEWNWKRAMDAQILQKILPKLHGSKRKIGSLLAALARYCEQGARADAEFLLSHEINAETYLAAEDTREKSPIFKESYLKLCEMMEAVRRDQFVSFIQ